MKNLLIAATLLLTTAKINAADLCVAENGTGGCFPTITDALNAAVDGDRILVNPKSGNAAYVENLNITKSIQILCNVEGAQYTTQGNITINPAADRLVIITGMNNLTGSVSASGASPVGPRCIVKIMNCNFVSGAINFAYDNFDVAVVSNIITDGNVFIRYGKVIGNDIKTTNNWVNAYSIYRPSIYLYTDASATNDTMLIVGNKINTNFSGGYPMGIYDGSTSQFVTISNNYITGLGTYMGIYMETSKSSTIGRNTIINNTLNFSGVAISYGIYALPVANSYCDIYNNLTLASSGTGVTGNAQCSVSYNFMNSPLTISGVVNDGTNKLTSNTTLAVTGKPNAGSDAINGGYPDKGFYDINLTVNDAGAFGGSLTLDNYFPITGAARVYMISAPRKVTVGSTINVTADGFDR